MGRDTSALDLNFCYLSIFFSYCVVAGLPSFRKLKAKNLRGRELSNLTSDAERLAGELSVFSRQRLCIGQNLGDFVHVLEHITLFFSGQCMLARLLRKQ